MATRKNKLKRLKKGFKREELYIIDAKKKLHFSFFYLRALDVFFLSLGQEKEKKGKRDLYNS